MFAYIWPIVLVVIANVFYHICSKSTPNDVNPFLVITITYIVGAIISIALFFITGKGDTNIVEQMKHVNWAPYVLGIAIVGLEAGNIYAYKAGWEVSIESLVQNAILAVVLIFVGFLMYHETLSWNKIVGIVICLVGLVFINIK